MHYAAIYRKLRKIKTTTTKSKNKNKNERI
jgi:hypothetical protein